MEKSGFLIVKGRDPSGVGECEFRIAIKQVKHLEDHGPDSKYYDLISVHEVLGNPRFIFEGLRRAGQDTGLCYVGCPEQHGSGWKAPGAAGFVFLVYLNKETTIFEWGWEKEDAKNPGLPLNTNQRFGTLKWKH